MEICKILDYDVKSNEEKVMVYKHPAEDFNYLTQLIVHESQEALFYMNGQALDLFGPGRYTLETQNIPIIGGALKLVTGGKSPFHCEVYFINKNELLIKWGTDSRVEYIEPVYGFPVSIGASGEMSIRVEDSRKLLVKLIGTENIMNEEKFKSFFQALLRTKIKSYIAQTIKDKKINIFEIDENLASFSEDIKNLLVNDFAEYGIALEKFYVTTVLKPDGDEQYKKFKELHIRKYTEIEEANLQAQKVVIESQALATKRAQEGYTYQQERAFDVADKVADNETVGQYTNLGVGLGMMAGTGAAVGTTAFGAVKDALNSMDGTNQNAFKEKVEKLAMMKEAGLISDKEFKELKAQLLAEIM